MTKNKRFTIDVETYNYENAFFDKGEFVCYEDDFDMILQKLNELADENEKLTTELMALKLLINDLSVQRDEFFNGAIENAELNEKLLKENEQLKQEIQGYEDDRTRFEEEARIDAIDNALDEENEKLKKENEKLKERIKQLQINNKVLKKIYKTFYKPRGIKYD